MCAHKGAGGRRPRSSMAYSSSIRNVAIGATAIGILGIGYLLDHRSEPKTPQFVSLSPGKTDQKAQRTPKGAKRQKAPTKNDESESASEEPLRDPFAREDTRSSKPRERPSLEQLELSQLRLVAIVRDMEGRFGASVEDASGLGFMLREGTRIGGQSVVRSISQQEVVVEEERGREQILRLR